MKTRPCHRSTCGSIIDLTPLSLHHVMPLAHFHPAVSAWFSRSFAAPTPAQMQAWAAIRSGAHTLVAAPTGSGKTLAAFLCAIDALVLRAHTGQLRCETEVLYISPLKALSNDIQRSLETPLRQIQEDAYTHGLPGDAIRAQALVWRSRSNRRMTNCPVAVPRTAHRSARIGAGSISSVGV